MRIYCEICEQVFYEEFDGTCPQCGSSKVVAKELFGNDIVCFAHTEPLATWKSNNEAEYDA